MKKAIIILSVMFIISSLMVDHFLRSQMFHFSSVFLLVATLSSWSIVVLLVKYSISLGTPKKIAFLMLLPVLMRIFFMILYTVVRSLSFGYEMMVIETTITYIVVVYAYYKNFTFSRSSLFIWLTVIVSVQLIVFLVNTIRIVNVNMVLDLASLLRYSVLIYLVYKEDMKKASI